MLQGINNTFQSENVTCLDVGLWKPFNYLKINIIGENEKKSKDVLWKYIKKKIIAELNVDQKLILDYIITRWCNSLENESTDEGVGDCPSAYYNFLGWWRGMARAKRA